MSNSKKILTITVLLIIFCIGCPRKTPIIEDPEKPRPQMSVQYDSQVSYNNIDKSKIINAFNYGSTDVTFYDGATGLADQELSVNNDPYILFTTLLSYKTNTACDMHIMFVQDVSKIQDVGDAAGYTVALVNDITQTGAKGPNSHSVVCVKRIHDHLQLESSHQWDINGQVYYTRGYNKTAIHELGHQRAGLSEKGQASPTNNSCAMVQGFSIVGTQNPEPNGVPSILYTLPANEYTSQFCSTCDQKIYNETW